MQFGVYPRHRVRRITVHIDLICHAEIAEARLQHERSGSLPKPWCAFRSFEQHRLYLTPWRLVADTHGRVENEAAIASHRAVVDDLAAQDD